MNKSPQTYKTLFFLFLLFVNLTAICQPAGYTAVSDESTFASELNRFTSNLQTIQSDFTQEKHLQYLESALVSKGKFWFEAPNSVRWEYQYPYKYILLLNNGKLKMISDDSSNEFDTQSNEMFKQVNDLIVGAVSGKIYEQDEYKVKTYENSKRYLVALKPSSSYISELISKIELYFDKNSYTVVEINMVENTGDYTKIRFSNQVLNEQLPENIFTL